MWTPYPVGRQLEDESLRVLSSISLYIVLNLSHIDICKFFEGSNEMGT